MQRKVFEYTRKSVMEELPFEQQCFMAKIISHDVAIAAEQLGVSEEVAYEMYSKGLLGSDRIL